MELKFGSIPIRVHGWFILMTLMLGANEREPVKLGAWVVVVTVSVIIHELGHALAGKAFGLVPRIELHGMGGTTSFSAPATSSTEASRAPLGTGKNVLISLAGPFAGFGFALLVLALRLAGHEPTHPVVVHAISLLFFVNVGWGVFNLLPMLPLDGGNVLRSVLGAFTRKDPLKGERVARVVSIVVALAISLYALRGERWWILYLGVLFAFRNVQALRQAGQMATDQALASAIEQGHRALAQQEPAAARRLLEPALRGAASPDLRQLGVRVYVAALLKDAMWPEAVSTLERERAVVPRDDLHHYASLLREVGQPDAATRVEALGQSVPALREFRA